MNINNGKTGNVNIPGALHSTGGDGDGQIGGVVAYAGDVYDETLGKNQKEINQTLLNGSADSNVIAVALNDLNEKVEEQEKVISNALNDLDDKIGYEIKTTNNITNPTKNTYYDLTNSAISTLDITNVSVNNINEVVILFLTSSSCTITALTTQRILGSTSLASNTVYIMSIIRGVVCIVEAPLYVAPQSE